MRHSTIRLATVRPATLRLVAAAAVVGAAALGLTACTPAGSSDSASGSSSASVLPPVIEKISDLDGTTVQVPLTNTVDLVTADGDDVTAWSAEIADDTIAEFVRGKEDGGATFNPGLTPLAAGTTDVVLTNTTTGEKVAFTLEVTAG